MTLGVTSSQQIEALVVLLDEGRQVAGVPEVFLGGHVRGNIAPQYHDILHLVRLQFFERVLGFLAVQVHASEVSHRFGMVGGKN